MPFPFSVMIKPRGAVCNLDCAYCYYLDKQSLYPSSDGRMPDDVLETFTRQYLAAHAGQAVVFAWQGGEPLLAGLDFFERALALQRRYCPAGTRIANSLQTNATLVNDAWARFFARHSFLVGVSLDGPQALHDAYRVDQAGRPTFERVMAGLRALQRQQVEYNLLTTVHAANAARPLEVYRFLRDEVGARFIQFIPIVEPGTPGPDGEIQVSSRSVEAQAYGDFLIQIFEEWRAHDIGQVFVQLFDVALGAWLKQPASLCIFSETCGRGLALEHTGDLYACDHFVQVEYRLGNLTQQPLLELVRSAQQRRFGQQKSRGLPRQCRGCRVRFICNGECPRNRFRRTSDGEAGLNYLCAGYRAFFTHIDPHMRRMAAEIRSSGPARRSEHPFSGT